MAAYPGITVQNQLDLACVVYDAFQNNPGATPSADDFFGTLTPLATVTGGTSQTIAPIHGPISTYLMYTTDGAPIAREVTLGASPATFAISTADTARMTATGQFVDFITDHPQDTLATTFAALLTAAKPIPNVNGFFKTHAPYQVCTFVSYLMTIAARAKPAGKPVQDTTCSLKQLCNYLGGTWPPGFPDIAISNFTCNDSNDTLIIGGDVDARSLPFAEIAIPFIQSLLPDPLLVHAKFSFHYGFDAGVFGTAIEFDLPSLNLPGGVHLNKPTLSLNINPLFQFVVFTARATIPFSLFSSPPFTANISMTIDNLEAAVGVVIDGDTSSLLTPPVMRGVHFDQFGVGMGVMFEPPAFALGVQGKFHIGEGANTVALDDDTFVVVCSLEGDVPNPLYISFYVPKMEFADIITILTDVTVELPIPITVTDLSFKWLENPMEPVILPDGTLASMAYGFTGQLAILGWSFYGDIELSLSGASGTLTTAPLSLGPLSLKGNGAGVTIRFDVNGNPIRNNQLATTRAIRDAITHGTTQILVAPGGPSLTLSTSSSPYLSIGGSLSLFELVNDSITATVGSNGISFELDFGSVLHTKMQCKLADFHNFTGTFTYGLDADIPLPTIAGFSLGHISLDVDCNATLVIGTSLDTVSLSVGAGFSFEGLGFSVGPFGLNVNISSITSVLSEIGSYLIDHAAEIFKAIIDDAGRWAKWVADKIVAGVEDIARGLKIAFNQTLDEAAHILSNVGMGLNDAASALKNAFGAGATDVGHALKGAYGDVALGVGEALKQAGYALTDISSALSSVFGADPAIVNVMLQNIGYGVDDIKNAFESLGGNFANFAEDTWDKVKHIFNPSNW